ncbi:MAG: hypothetical protein IPJ88_01310 [Myxococcales bacterium]|nr:MAG: hypothetical protein IPJ88_01310 [Myxococcales bacterium]
MIYRTLLIYIGIVTFFALNACQPGGETGLGEAQGANTFSEPYAWSEDCPAGTLLSHEGKCVAQHECAGYAPVADTEDEELFGSETVPAPPSNMGSLQERYFDELIGDNDYINHPMAATPSAA